MKDKDLNTYIASRVKIHDVHQFEIKLEYNIEELRKSNNYKIETYLFIPQSLQINEKTYPREVFYNDLQNYIRFKTPTYSFRMITDPEFRMSPFYVLEANLRELMNTKERERKNELVKECIKELKLLGIMVRARIRDFAYSIERNLKEKNEKMPRILSRLQKKIDRSTAIIEKLRRIHREFEDNFPGEKELFKYFRIVEEFISHILEEEFIKIIKKLSKNAGGNPCFDDIQKNFCDFCKREKDMRQERAFSLRFDNDEQKKERFLYNLSQYKKAVASVLYLNINREKKGESFEHMVGATAAFTASLVYFAISFFISRSFAGMSFPFVLLISLGYVFKDRVKELFKVSFRPKVLSRFPDHNTQIIDTSEDENIKLGEVREKVFFTQRGKLNPEILHYRDKTRTEMDIPRVSPEEILVYQKEIDINTATILERHKRTINLTDIMRFNIHRYLEKMDNPEQKIYYYDEDNSCISTTTGHRTYHINLVLKYSVFHGKKEETRYERYRIVADKWGILRVETVGP